MKSLSRFQFIYQLFIIIVFFRTIVTIIPCYCCLFSLFGYGYCSVIIVVAVLSIIIVMTYIHVLWFVATIVIVIVIVISLEPLPVAASCAYVPQG